MTKRSLIAVAGRAASAATRDFFEPVVEVAGRLFGSRTPEIRKLGTDEFERLLSNSANRRAIRNLYSKQLKATIRQRKARQSHESESDRRRTTVGG